MAALMVFKAGKDYLTSSGSLLQMGGTTAQAWADHRQFCEIGLERKWSYNLMPLTLMTRTNGFFKPFYLFMLTKPPSPSPPGPPSSTEVKTHPTAVLSSVPTVGANDTPNGCRYLVNRSGHRELAPCSQGEWAATQEHTRGCGGSFRKMEIRRLIPCTPGIQGKMTVGHDFIFCSHVKRPCCWLAL